MIACKQATKGAEIDGIIVVKSSDIIYKMICLKKNDKNNYQKKSLRGTNIYATTPPNFLKYFRFAHLNEFLLIENILRKLQ
jgi:chromosome segregation and condensation protein ScpB